MRDVEKKCGFEMRYLFLLKRQKAVASDGRRGGEDQTASGHGLLLDWILVWAFG